MKWVILVLVIIILVQLAIIVMRDPKRGGSVGIHGVDGKKKVGKGTLDAKGKAISFGVRPEDLRIVGAGANVLFEGKVDYIEQLGEVQLVYVDIGRPNEPVTAKLPGNAEIQRGATLRLTADAGDLHIFDDKGLSFARPRIEAKAA